MSKPKKTKTIKKKTQRRPSSGLTPLRPGDLIEIVAPGSHSPDANLTRGAEVLRSWGYKVRYEPDLLKPELFLANTDEKRMASLKKALTDPQVKAVWCLRGGYGAIRLLPWLEKIKTPTTEKLLIGLSDISSLHAVLNQKWKWPSLHASLIDRLALEKLSDDNISELREVLENPDYITEFANLRPLNPAAVKLKKNVKSKVVGGNLMVVTSTLGTPSQIRTSGKILFLEELAERAYRVDRCLQQLKQAGVFDGAEAVVFGDFLNCDEPNKDNYIQQVLEEFFREMKLPAYTGIETGHAELQRPLFFNTETHITCEERPRMLVYSPFKKPIKK